MSAPQPDRSAVTTLALAEAARRMQLQNRAQFLADATRLWPVLDFKDLDSTWPRWLRVMAALIGRHHKVSSDQAGLFYRAARQHATGDPGPAEIVKSAASPADEWVTKALGYAAPGRFQYWTDKQGATPEIAARHALVATLGTGSRIVLDGGRTTTFNSAQADPKVVGWQRITDGDPCAFCALMASRVHPITRAAVYRDAGTAGEDANKRFTGAGKFKFHNDCGCTAVPTFTHFTELDPVAQQAAQVYEDGAASLAAFRKAWNERER
jgi:hypothetical protein